ncbi:MAG TPA: acyl-CoA dehydrogenase family protein, partial [Dehalococcoidia bacterium]|nr:acyl-CoA dehydrogenase family protein [Dehalococcoidia bacterium]
MDFGDTPQEAAFRRQVREFLRRELPTELCRELIAAGPITDLRFSFDHSPAMRLWLDALRQRRWLAANWPPEYGGAGLTSIEQFILKEEMALARAPIPWSIGLNAIGPTIIAHGTPSQKERYLPSILAMDVWCQGFSEPMVGSDLASVTTRAFRNGSDYTVQGDKIWTTGGHKGRFMLLLARTDPEAPKHRGLSCFILDMQAPGVTIKPLINMAETLEIAQVFLDDVRVPQGDLLGEENQGWRVANTTLDHERSTIGEAIGQRQAVEDLARLIQELRGPGSLSPALRHEMAARYIEAMVAGLLAQRVIWLLKQGQPVTKEASQAKLFSTELAQRIARTGMKLLGLYGQLGPDSPWAPFAGLLVYIYL